MTKELRNRVNRVYQSCQTLEEMEVATNYHRLALKQDTTCGRAERKNHSLRWSLKKWLDRAGF